MKKIHPFNIWAILAGWMISYGGQSLVSWILAIYALTQMGALMRGVSPSQRQSMTTSALKSLPASGVHLLFLLGAMVVFTVLGAFVTAHIAKEAPWPNVGGLIAVRLLFSVIILSTHRAAFSAFPVWYLVTVFLIAPPLAYLGGLWRVRTRRAVDASTHHTPSWPPIPPVSRA